MEVMLSQHLQLSLFGKAACVSSATAQRSPGCEKPKAWGTVFRRRPRNPEEVAGDVKTPLPRGDRHLPTAQPAPHHMGAAQRRLPHFPDPQNRKQKKMGILGFFFFNF